MADLPKLSVEEYIARHDDIAELLGREKLSVLMSSVTLPDDLDEKSKVNYEHLKASRQRFSENAWTCLVLSQQGLIR